MRTTPEGDLSAASRTPAALLASAYARLALRAVDRLGPRAQVAGAPYIENLGRIEIGSEFRMRAGATRSHLVTGPSGVLRIGDGVVVGAGAAIAANASVVVGDHVHLGASVMILDSDYHATEDHGAPGDAAAIVIGAGARLEDRVIVLKGARIGARAHVVSGSVVSGTIHDDAFVSGVPARATKRLAATSADSHALVLSALEEVLGASPALALGAHPSTLRGWDSLATLRLLVAIESGAGVALPERDFVAARDLAAIVAIVDRARSR